MFGMFSFLFYLKSSKNRSFRRKNKATCAGHLVSNEQEDVDIYLRNAAMMKYSKQFHKLGISTIGDLLTYFNENDIEAEV